MAISVTHATLVSSIASVASSVSAVRPTEWNAAHTVTGALAIPSSGTDNALARFNGGSSAIQDSGAILADDGDFTLPGTNPVVPATSSASFPGGMFWTQDESLIARNPTLFGNFSQYGKLWLNCSDPTQETWNDWAAGLVCNNFFHGDQVLASGIAGYFSLNSTGTSSGVNNFAGLDISLSLNSDNTGTNWNGGLTCASLFATNFSQVLNSSAYFTGLAISMQDYANVGLQCRTNYTDFIGIKATVQHRGIGASSNVVGIRVSPSNGYSPNPGAVGACHNLIGVDIRQVGFPENITNAWGMRIQDYSSAGSAESYNIKSEGANSVNLFEGQILASRVEATVLKSSATVVGSLLASSVAGAGARSFVTDANSTTFGASAVGGGANAMPVWTNGSTSGWYIG